MWPYTDEELEYISNLQEQPTAVPSYNQESMLYKLWPSQLPNYDFDTYGHGA